MSKEKNSIVCPHKMGLKCRVCYDQTYGLDWKSPVLTPQAETDRLMQMLSKDDATDCRSRGQ